MKFSNFGFQFLSQSIASNNAKVSFLFLLLLLLWLFIIRYLYVFKNLLFLNYVQSICTFNLNRFERKCHFVFGKSFFQLKSIQGLRIINNRKH